MNTYTHIRHVCTPHPPIHLPNHPPTHTHTFTRTCTHTYTQVTDTQATYEHTNTRTHTHAHAHTYFTSTRIEPRNPYDGNAVAVKNHKGSLVGYISRNVAVSLAPIMDNTCPNDPRMEAVVLKRDLIKVSFYAPASLCERTSKRLSQNGIVLQSPEVGTDNSMIEGCGGCGGSVESNKVCLSVVVAKMGGSGAQMSSQEALEALETSQDLQDNLSNRLSCFIVDLFDKAPRGHVTSSNP